MRLEAVRSIVGDACCMTLEQAQTISEVIRENDARAILELGFRHGVSTCYMAAVLQEIGGGKVVTIDLKSAETASPMILDLLAKLDLEKYVDVYFEPTSYTWRLMKFLEQHPNPSFDLCYLDGAHNWFVDGFAFFLVDRLLRPGGLIVFDDLDWSYEVSPSLKGSALVQQMPAEERVTAQVRKVYELLVKTHPGYADFVVRDGWAYARKVEDHPNHSRVVVQENVVETRYVGIGSALHTLYRRLMGRL